MEINLKDRIIINRTEVLQLFFDRIENMGEWSFDEGVTADAIRSYTEGCVEMTRRMLDLFKAGDAYKSCKEPDTKCDRCDHLYDCIACGDMVDVKQESDLRHHFKPSSLYKCPEGRYPGHTLQEQNELREQMKKEDPCYECPRYDYLHQDDCKECDHYECRKEKVKEEE